MLGPGPGMIDPDIRRLVYEQAMAGDGIPTAAALAQRVRLPLDQVRASLERLASARILVLQGESREILMAPPYSAIPTPFGVISGTRSSYANCIWDALGVPVMQREPATIRTACGCCHEAMTLNVTPDGVKGGEGVAHFAVPASRWWEDIVFT